ncbi:MAG: hypothetical protein ACLQBB_09335 [Solirubrobacteraceae bacterium]
MGKLGRLGLEPAVRYERQTPGELIHIDVKKLGRIQIPGHRVTVNRRAHARRHHYSHTKARGTDNGSGYRSTVHALACRTLRIKHLRTRAYRPQGRALHPHDARRLGLRRDLPRQQRAHSRP